MSKEALDTLYWIGGIIIGSGLIEISPIKLNPWTWVLSPLRKALTGGLTAQIGEVQTQVNTLQQDLLKHIDESREEEVKNARQRILRFNDEIIQKQKHSKEHFDDILGDIDLYEDYCVDHPKFPNNRAVMAINHIKETYERLIKEGKL